LNHAGRDIPLPRLQKKLAATNFGPPLPISSS